MVRAPKRASRAVIDGFLDSKADWIRRQIDIRKQRMAAPLEYRDGELHYWLGDQLPLHILPGAVRSPEITLQEGRIRIVTRNTDPDTIKAALLKWYRRQANSFFNNRLEAIARDIPWLAEMPDLKLRLMRTQWGSCSVKRVITLNPHLIKAPPVCIDQVIMHELCHLKEHNHSRRFYRLLEALAPDHRQISRQLNEIGDRILNV